VQQEGSFVQQEGSFVQPIFIHFMKNEPKSLALIVFIFF